MNNEAKVFADTGASLLIKTRFQGICEEALAEGVDRYILSVALIGAALDQIQERDGRIGQMIFLRDVADQIEEALKRDSTAPN